MTFNITTI